MSSYNWNWRNGNVHDSNRAPPMPNDRTEIACRICDRVFMNTQALINHIESHIEDDGLTASRLRQFTHQTNINPWISSNPPIRPNPTFPLPNPFHQRNPFHGVNNQVGFALPPPPPPPPHHQYPYPQQSQVSPYSSLRNIQYDSGVGTSHYMTMPYANQTVPMVTEEDFATSDCTRLFLSQLDHPIPPTKYELVRSSDNVDLTLKL